VIALVWRTGALVLAMLVSCMLVSIVPASAAAPPERGEPRVVSVDVDSTGQVTLVVRLGPRTPERLPATAFSVAPGATSEPLRVTQLGSQDLDLMIAFDAAGTATARREVRAAAAEVLLTLPPGGGAQIMHARSTGTLHGAEPVHRPQKPCMHGQRAAKEPANLHSR
jgi:hypothetical protein